MQQTIGTKAKKPYETPARKKLVPEEAKRALLDHARKGDQGAKDILELVLHTRR